ncbi:15632_t:CDS:10 [Entrophospora sp. SA101]|nr:15632_t:CDS:10 [Entrophospora sp. SA101]
MSLKYLSQKIAQTIDQELMSPAGGGFSIDQLMELAGLSIAQAVAHVYDKSNHSRILVCCGPGNNGGDGLVAARHLSHFGYQPKIYYPKQTNKELYQRLVQQCKNLQIAISNNLHDHLEKSDLVIDAIFGFSFQGEVRDPFKNDIQKNDLPAYLTTYVQRFVTGDYSVEPISKDDKGKPILYRDTFGFRKLLIFLTKNKLVALDTGNKGQIVWSRYFGKEIRSFEKLIVVRSSTVKYPPVIVAIGHQIKEESYHIKFIRLNALTGEDFISNEHVENYPPIYSISGISRRIFKLPVEEPDERMHIIAVIDDDSKLHLYPNHKNSRKAFKNFTPSFYFTLSENTIHSEGLKGYSVNANISDELQHFDISEVWNIHFPDDEKISAIGHRPQYEKVASLGRVLGDRSVLYKYLNPHLVAVATLSSSESSTATLNIYLIDIVKGSILYQYKHENVGKIHPINIVQVENTVLYVFWSENESTKGYQVVVYDFYESEKKDERINSPVFSSFSHERPYVNAQAFMLPYGVKTIGVTTTKNGIAIREFLFALDTDQILGLSKRILDPRRPLHALTSEDKEEMLIPYDPAIPDNKKFILSYYLSVAGVKRIITSPALLESTSLVLAYGLDLWFTREAPSKTFDVLSEDFTVIITLKSTLMISELLENIFINLDYGDLYSCLTVNRQWNLEASRCLINKFNKDLDSIKKQLEWIEKKGEQMRVQTNEFIYSGINWRDRRKLAYEIKDIYSPLNLQVDHLLKLHLRLACSSELHKSFYKRWKILYKQAKLFEKRKRKDLPPNLFIILENTL